VEGRRRKKPSRGASRLLLDKLFFSRRIRMYFKYCFRNATVMPPPFRHEIENKRVAKMGSCKCMKRKRLFFFAKSVYPVD
jgi:hypothetical protein